MLGNKNSGSNSELHRLIALYRSLGFAVIPINYRKKTPAIPSWKEFQTRKPTDQEVEAWFNKQSNVAIVTGAVSDNLVVLDFDQLDVARKFFGSFEELTRRTLTVETSKGLHIYLRSLKAASSFKILKLKLDVKAEGSYVLAPPSLHPSGKAYRFINPDVREVVAVDDAAGSIRRRARQLGATPTVSSSPQRATPISVKEWVPLSPKEIASIVKTLAPYWIPGSRNDLTCALLGYLIKKSVDEESAYAVIDQLTTLAGDEEREGRLRLVRYHYRNRIRLGLKLKAASGIREIVAALRGSKL